VKFIIKILLVYLVSIPFCSFATQLKPTKAYKETILQTRVYNNIAIQTIDIEKSKIFHENKIIISKSFFKKTSINGKIFKMPQIGAPIWIITASDLHVTENTCLTIDALLCGNYHEIFKSNEAICHYPCISDGPELIAFDEKKGILYLDAGTNVEGTAGAPRFLFSADIHTKKIKYLNTFIAPYTAYLSPNGNHIAIFDEYNEIDICNTRTGNILEIHGQHESSAAQYNNLSDIKWLNENELEYMENNQNKFTIAKKNIVNVNSKK